MGNTSLRFRTGLRDYFGKPFYFLQAADRPGENVEIYLKGMETGPEKTEQSIIRFGEECKAEVRKHENGIVDYSETILTDSEAYSSKLKIYLESALQKSEIMQKLVSANPNAGWKVDSQEHRHMAGGGVEVSGSNYERDHIEVTVELDVTAKNMEDAIKEISGKTPAQLLAEGILKKRSDEDDTKGGLLKFRAIFLVKVEVVGATPALEESAVKEVRSLVETAQTETLM